MPAGNIAAALAAAIEGSHTPFGQAAARQSPSSGPRQSLVRHTRLRSAYPG